MTPADRAALRAHCIRELVLTLCTLGIVGGSVLVLLVLERMLTR